MKRMIHRESKVLVTGSTGMVGSAVAKIFSEEGFNNLLTPTHQELNLCDQKQVNNYFEHHRPEYVLMIAAKVGGIAANSKDPVGFISINTKIQLNLFEACYKYKTKKNLFLGSSCIYPKECPQPMKEEYLLTGALEPTNEAYALAKIMGLKLAQYYYQQYGSLTICPMPCNIYGTNDHFDLNNSHVLSALVKRFVDAREENKPCVTLWGTGSAKREFIHVDDVASAIFLLMNNYDSPEIINLGTGKDISIKELALLISDKVGYQGKIQWDTSKPNGMERKCLDVNKLRQLGFHPKVSLENGIERTINEYFQF